MNDFKSALRSKTVWAGIITVLASLLGMLGYSIGAEDQAWLVNALPEIVTFLAGFVAIIGRVTAKKKIG